MVGEMVARNDLIVLNQGGEFTFRPDDRLVGPRGNNLE